MTRELVRKTVAETVRRPSDPAAKWTPELAARNLYALLDDEKLAGVGGAVPEREADHAGREGQLMAPVFPAEAEAGRVGMGQLPGDAAHQFIFDEEV